ncbi:hypothetical protein L2E82_36110 [Cichorium intybus]|uniref:Uncharacterized protein n=1 Tax=Cichorium intybus TaxID=13427 RepID=A0ACB9BQS8_CICIN|nr:hypothetical protein L2E82_36110 [Cichorium intybus]
MASFKSSSSSVGRWTHEVFLSFRGEDTRNNFVDHLYAALDQRGIHAFKDDKALDKGKPISLELLKAIEESKFAVVEDNFGRDTDRVNKWRKALVAAAGLSGWHIKETGYVGESAIILEIVEKISAEPEIIN